MSTVSNDFDTTERGFLNLLGGFFRDLSVSGKVGFLIVGAWIFVAIAAPIITPHGPYEMNEGQELTPPSLEHLTGTDEFGRDILTRTLYGARYSIGIAFGGVLGALLVGGIMGLFAGVYGGVTDTLIMRSTDILLSFPPILLGIFVVSIAGPGVGKVGLAIFIANVPRFIRFTRASVHREMSLDYVDAARALGAKRLRIMFRHVAPNTISSLVIYVNIAMVDAILLEAGLSFVGLGAQAPQPSWGLLLRDARSYLTRSASYALAPGLALSSLMIGLNLVVDSLRTALDPKK